MKTEIPDDSISSNPNAELLPIGQRGIAVIRGDKFVTEWVRETQKLCHDDWLAEQMRRYIKPGDVALDIGANIGQSTYPMLAAGAFVYAFEIDPDCCACILHNCAGGTMELRGGVAVGDDPNAFVGYTRDANNVGASHVQAGTQYPVLTIDELDFQKIAFIKIDVEGSEVSVLRGAVKTISRTKPTMFIEVNRGALERLGESEDSLWALLDSMGYSVEVAQDNCQRGDAQYDVVARPKLSS